ncbi:MAG TPA: NfeD family protein [Phycicoccus sp.]|jgi:membrane protein implicated in regulation of membrane protease activity|nr:NfeD family protein [Phycicoccus sp.]HQH07261.1 NfeD family protein [Phycicoccus sp.]HQK30711.1 NfeD family protein [Phycicoccus sp.]HQV91733.1 NfeD family protein [Phycicoccus sp.]HQY96889.1 NfeD family protein [Phycicoccus sp.]
MNWLTENPWLAWLGIALILAAIEAATVDFTFVMLAGGALAGGVAAALGAGLAVQVIVAVLVAVLLILVVRPLIRRHFVDGQLDHGIGAASLVGREARVIDLVTETSGRIKLAGETWSARTPSNSPECLPGSDVRVIELAGATALVVPAHDLPNL